MPDMGRFSPEIPHEELNRRRAACQAGMEPDSLLLVFTAPRRIMSNDVHYRYRQDSDFYYLTGLPVEEGVLALMPDSATVFVKPGSPEKETWEGPQPNLDETAEISGIPSVKDLSEFDGTLENLINGKQALYYAYGLDSVRDHLILSTSQRLILRGRAGASGPGSIIHPALLLHELRLIKTSWEIERMKETAAITDEAHREVISAARPGMGEYELEAILHRVFSKHNASEAYPSIVAGGRRACILHYIKNDEVLKDDELVLMDAAAARGYIHSDVTRTFPVGNHFSEPQKELYNVVLQAQRAAVEASVVGATMDGVHERALNILLDGLVGLGIAKESKEQMLEQKSYRRFYMHRTGHWIGYDVHDVGSYYQKSQPRPFEPGMVCTVEPGLYIPGDDDIPEHFRNIGIRIEDDVEITENGPLNLTQSVPVSIEQIEELKC
ncbi:MAG: aminopeptidase P N-terminal domain-containing protein [Leptospiraceae bacterium]|nr:aminopeptidase P N-terminal domain-containing protein [Leptospiraceae bacterium]